MGIRKKRTAGSIVCILLTALFSVLAVSGCAKTEDAVAGSVEQEEQTEERVLSQHQELIPFSVRQLIIPPAMALKEHMAKTVPSRTASAVMVRSWRKDMIRRKAK